MLAFDEMHFNHNMSSQLNYYSFKKPSDFTFCDIPKRKYHRNYDENENSLWFSPPLWSKNIHLYGTGSAISSPNKTMVEGRKALKEMVNDSPELCYELSLKDMVAKEPDDSGLVMEDYNKVDMKPELKGKKKSPKRGPISRTVSLDTGGFLLKMFVPSSFGPKKHQVTRSSSFDGLKRCHVEVKQCNIGRGSHMDGRCCTTANKKRSHLLVSCFFNKRTADQCCF